MGESQGRGCFWGRQVVAVVVVAVVVVVSSLIPSQRKSYTVDDVRIRATVRAD